MITVKSFPPPDFDKSEILRYSACKYPDENVLQLLDSCISESKDIFIYKVCYTVCPVTFSDNICNLNDISVQSKTLSKALDGCNLAVVFGATVGLNLDRLITKYSRISPSRAVMLQAIGTERIESLCNLFCEQLKTKRIRVSAGYGDIPLDMQKDIFKLLGLQKHLNIYLNDSMTMSPSKSVTAIVGLE